MGGNQENKTRNMINLIAAVLGKERVSNQLVNTTTATGAGVCGAMPQAGLESTGPISSLYN